MALPNNARCTDPQFVSIWHELGCATAVAKRLDVAVSNVHRRRARIERDHGIKLITTPSGNSPAFRHAEFKQAYPREKLVEFTDGVIAIASDAHVWPGEWTPAMRGFLAVVAAVKPKMVVANGDFFDGARVSRHGRIGWARTPTVKEEMDAVQAYADEVVKTAAIADNTCAFEFNMGNHDLRLENYLSSRAGEMEGMPQMRLEDYLPRWSFQWSLLVNGDSPHPVMIKHRFASSGIHAGYNATLRAGMTTVSGHTHLLEAKAWGDYRGRRWGIQTGTLSDLHAPSMEYAENNPTSACPGFVILTFRDGMLLPPELAEVINGRCYFRGEVIA